MLARLFALTAFPASKALTISLAPGTASLLAPHVVKGIGRLLVIRIALLVSLVSKELITSNLPSATPLLLALLALADKLLLLVLPIVTIVLKANGARIMLALIALLVLRVLITFLPLLALAKWQLASLAVKASTPLLLVQLSAPLVRLVRKVLLLVQHLKPRLAILALLVLTVLLALLVALLALMVTILLRLEPLLVLLAHLPLREKALAKMSLLALTVLLVMLPLVVAPIAFAARKALGLPMTPRNANYALLVRLV